MCFFELASSIGIAAGAVLGPILWARFRLSAFILLAGVYVVAAMLVLGVHERPRRQTGGACSRCVAPSRRSPTGHWRSSAFRGSPSIPSWACGSALRLSLSWLRESMCQDSNSWEACTGGPQP